MDPEHPGIRADLASQLRPNPSAGTRP